jgi:hypothetical protein
MVLFGYDIFHLETNLQNLDVHSCWFKQYLFEDK